MPGYVAPEHPPGRPAGPHLKDQCAGDSSWGCCPFERIDVDAVGESDAECHAARVAVYRLEIGVERAEGCLLRAVHDAITFAPKSDISFAASGSVGSTAPDSILA